MMQSGYDIRQLVQEAQIRWLKPAEVLFILQNHEDHQITHEPPQKPPSGALFLFNKRVLRFFRKDGHNWRKKKDGRTVGEAHERLKVGNAEALNCYYAHGEDNPSFQRRSLWMLDPAYEHIVLVHYRNIAEQGSLHMGAISDLSPGPSSTFSLSHGSYSVQNPASVSLSHLQDCYQSQSSPGSVEVSSHVVSGSNEMNHFDRLNGVGRSGTKANLEVNRALRRLEEQLSLDEDIVKDYVAFDGDIENIDAHTVIDHNGGMQQSGNIQQDQFDDRHTGIVAAASSSSDLDQHSGGNAVVDLAVGRNYMTEHQNTLSWSDVFHLPNGSSPINSQEKQLCALEQGEKLLPSKGPVDQVLNHQWSFHGNNATTAPSLMPQEAKPLDVSAYSSSVPNIDQERHTELFDPSQFGMLIEADSSLTIACDQKFTIREISPQWGFANETTKVIIVGSFLCDPLQSAWSCMFGDVEVPLQIIQEGVVCCQAPAHRSGKVNLCITSNNRQSCSEIREFEYRDATSSCIRCDRPRGEDSKTTEELLLVVRFVHMLLSNSSMQSEDGNELGIDLLRKLKIDEDSWTEVMESLLIGSGTPSATTDWLLQELLKDKLHPWLSSRVQGGVPGSDICLSRKEQGIIHVIAGLGYEWALNPILSAGVGVNFRDINGWTALHWAARFGREKMVAALIASGASAGVVTDPTSQDPRGKTPASIAAASGHKGLAGYLSEIALTSHLSSLTMGENEHSKGSADVQAEITVNNVVNKSAASNVDNVSLRPTLEAVRNAAQAAARIQAAFRARSFRRRQGKDVDTSFDEYGFSANDYSGLSAASKLVFRSLSEHNSAALSIQKNYRGYKGRKKFLTLRQKVVKIQAHIRGYQVRKKYRVICWAVGIWDKVVLRWRRKKGGLRKPESEATKKIDGDEDEDDDIVKLFRKEKVNVAIDEAVSRVLSMVDSPEARQQYLRMLEKYQQAKAELGAPVSEVSSSATLPADVFNMDDDDIFNFM